MKKSLYKMIAVFLLFTMLLTGCSIQNQNATASKQQTTSANTTKLENPFTSRDLSGEVNEDTAIKITLNNDKTNVDEDGVQMVDGDLVISKEGTYILEGELENGQVRVDADENAKIQIVLNGVTLTCQDGPAIQIMKADKVFLTLGKDTKNSVTDGSKYDLADGEDEPNAAIYSKADLTINGEGTLVVNGNYKHGIVSKDDLKIASGTIQVKAVGDGIKGKDLVAIADGTITITAKGDGITSAGIIEIKDGDFAITTNGGSENSIKTAKGDENPMGGQPSQGQQPPQMPSGQQPPSNGTGQQGAPSKEKPQEPPAGQKNNQETATTQDGTSSKGLKAETKLSIYGGSFKINTSDDGIHAGGNIVISNGDIQISSGDDGIHADNKLTITGGSIQITESYEGLEAADILVSDGTVTIVSSDDGFNASGGTNVTSTDQKQGQKGFGNIEDVSIVIQGGTITVNANGDGIDSNGTLLVSGGTTTVYGPVNDGNGPIDYGSEATVTGGSIIAGGSSGMAEGFTTSKNQGSILSKLSSVVKANTEIVITDSNGNQVVTYTSPKDLSALIFSTSDIKKGETYTIKAGSISTRVIAE